MTTPVKKKVVPKGSRGGSAGSRSLGSGGGDVGGLQFLRPETPTSGTSKKSPAKKSGGKKKASSGKKAVGVSSAGGAAATSSPLRPKTSGSTTVITTGAKRKPAGTERAPIELTGQFLACIMGQQFKEAEALCRQILVIEPGNPTFLPVIRQKLMLDAEAAAEESSSDESSDEDGNEDEGRDDSDEGVDAGGADDAVAPAPTAGAGASGILLRTAADTKGLKQQLKITVLMAVNATASTGGSSFGCDPHGGERGVCVNGYGNFPTSACGNGCVNKTLEGCTTDWDCSLAGVCTDGKCVCDGWTSGSDCSYLNFQPKDKSHGYGYIDPEWSSWGGNAVLGKDNQWHLFMAEIGPSGRKGLGGWQSHSQIAHAVSANPDGPYTRKSLVAPPEHHNPTLKVSPKDGSWNLYSIKAGSGPIVVSTSTDEGVTWTSTTPGTVNGTMTMWYRATATTSSPCSDESIGVQYCASATSKCGGGVNPVYTHTSEDPSVFVDKRGNYHMLVNALPGGCNPKLQQGGHAWSRDGVNWSEPRVGAYNTTVKFTDGTDMTCVRRERPQMVQAADGTPIAMIAGTVGCPLINGTAYKGGNDCFTLAQLMAV
eukprot:gene9536-33631_t